MTTTVDDYGNIVEDNTQTDTNINEQVFDPTDGGKYIGGGNQEQVFDPTFGGTQPTDYSFLKNLDPSKVSEYLKGNMGLTALLGGSALAAMGAGTPKTTPTIYQGGIPNLVATRNMITAPPTGRRAGAGGVNYGGDVTYSLAPAGQKPYSLTRGDSAFIADPAGQANVLKGTGGADTQSMANKIGYNLPGGWDSFTPQQKIAWFNQNNVSVEQLRAAGVPQSDIDWMLQNGYGSAGANAGITGATGATTGTAGGTGIDALVAAQNKAQTQADSIGLKLPSDWSTYDAAQKINWFNSNKITPEQLATAGVDQGTIDWMKSNGYATAGAQPASVGVSPGNSYGVNSGTRISDGSSPAPDVMPDDVPTPMSLESFKRRSDERINAGVNNSNADFVPENPLYAPPQDSRSKGLMSAIEQGMSQDQYIGNIRDWLTKNSTASDAEVYKQMQQYDIGAEDVAAALGVPVSTIQGKISNLLRPSENYGYRGPAPEVSRSSGEVSQPADLQPSEPVAPSPDSEQYKMSNRSAGLQSALEQGMTEDQYIGNIKNWLTQNSTASDAEVFKQMQKYDIGMEDVARALGVPISVIQSKIDALGENNYAQGGMAEGRYLQGGTDGMADKIPAQIGEDQPAALSHGEFVIPADVVSHMGNGNSDAGAKKLYEMMDRIRMARTGTKEQGKKINPDKFMPGGLAKAYANGGSVKNFATGGTTTVPANVTGTQAGLSNWAGEYTTDLLGQGRALANMPFQQYMGPLTAGPSALQNKVTQGLESLDFPGTLGKSFTSAGAPTIGADGQPVGGGGIASSYMNPYLKNVLDPQLEELRRQSQINLQPSLAKLTSAGGFGGGRQAIMESEAGRNLLNAQNTAIGTGYANAYDKAMQQFNTEQGQAKTLADMMAGQGATNRAIEAEGVAADKAQFEEARANPFKMVQFQQSLLSGMPINAMDYTVQDPSNLAKVAQGVSTVDQLLKVLYGIDPAKKVAGT